MATLLQILTRRYAGRWDVARGEDDFARITWKDGATVPTEAEMRAYSDAVDAEIAAEVAFAGKRETLETAFPNFALRCILAVVKKDRGDATDYDAIVAKLLDLGLVD